MSHNLNSLFAKLTEYLVAGNSPLPHLFQPPLDRDAVNAHVAPVNITLPGEVYALYNWHNGTMETEDYMLGQLWIFPLGIFSAIEHSVQAYNYYAGKDGLWQPSMFMLFEGGGGEMFLIDCDSQSPTYRQVLKHDYGAVDHEPITPVFDSVETLFLSIVECFEKKAFSHNEKGGLKFDLRLYGPIMKKNNPGCNYWGMVYGGL